MLNDRRPLPLILILLSLCTPGLAEGERLTHQQVKQAIGATRDAARVIKALPGSDRDVLEDATTFELLELDPAGGAKGPGSLQGYKILKRVKIASRTQQIELLRGLYRSLDYGGPVAKCYEPRHGIRAMRGDRTLELAICFTCYQTRIGGGSGPRLATTGRAAKALFDGVLGRRSPAEVRQLIGTSRDSAALKQALPGGARDVLEQAEVFELLSIDHNRTNKKGPGYFHGYKVNKRLRIHDQEQQVELLVATYRSLDHKGPLANCFSPHHGIRALWRGKQVDLVICFTCYSSRVIIDGGKPRTVGTGPTALKLMDRLLGIEWKVGK